ncbi:MAG: Crp/Fnr family transcriptional regulator [Chitinophagaceae bacterium]|nr:Crp/Fnr family transcriptional regulator [Chitinophagaceae bacterium]
MNISDTSMHESLAAFLGKFVRLQQDDFAQLQSKLMVRQFPKKHIITREGDKEEHLYFIVKGLVHQYFMKGEEMITTDLVPEGTISGAVASFLSGRPSHYYLETIEPVTALSISRDDLTALYASDTKWQRFGRILTTHFLLQLELHMLDSIRYSIRERLAHFAEEHPGLLKRVPQRRLASYLAIEPETFTRLKPLVPSKRKPVVSKQAAPIGDKALRSDSFTHQKKINPAYLEYAFRYFQQFMPLSKAEMEALLHYCEFREFGKKAILVQEGEVDNYLNMVVKGLVIKYVKVKKGEVILQLATEGHVIHSELSYLCRNPSPVTVQTLEPTILLSMRYDKMEEALIKYPQGEMLGLKILEGMYIKKDERKYAWQAVDVRQRFLDYMERHPHMLQRVPQKYIASYLNIKPETFSRLKHLTRSRQTY